MNPSDWRQCTLGDLLEIKHGYAFSGDFFGSSGTHVVLTPGNFFERGGFKHKGDGEKWYSGPVPAEYVLGKGDVIVAMTEQAEGLLGSSAIVPEGDLYLHNQRLGLICPRNVDAVDLRFLYYLFNLQDIRNQIRASASGVKIRHTSPSRISEVRVTVPPVDDQRRIARILAAYDDLLDNNTRRIQILEEMGRALYREWFVDLRFPGSAHTQFIETSVGKVPKDWSVRPLGEVIVLNYGKALKEAERRGGDVLVFGSSGIVGFHDVPLVKGPGLVVGRKGNVGSVFWSDRDFYPIDTAFYVTSSLPLRFMYFDLQTKNFLNSDAAVPGLSRRQAYSLETVVPRPDIVGSFCYLANAFAEGAASLQRQVANLQQTRDLLLPRLLSGQLSLAKAEEDPAILAQASAAPAQ